MLCCALGVATAGQLGAAWRIRSRRNVLPVAAIAAVIAGTTAGAHASHYAARAERNGRGLLAEIVAAPLCTGAPQPRIASPNPGERP